PPPHHPTPTLFPYTTLFRSSCSGTEPFAGCHQTSVAVETGGRVYFIDAGENAGYAAYLGGVPLPDTAAIFVTHTHMDHTGGLQGDRKSTRLNSSHVSISYAV